MISNEISALYAQGFIACCEITAPTPLRAVEIFKENEKLEINRLRQEVSRLQAAYDEMYRENESLRRNSSWPQESNSSMKYYEIFGFSSFPQPDELKNRYRSLRQRLHPDKGGDTQLFQLIQQVFDQLTKA
ncbi:J domain-containing protein [Pseudomonas sp. efr-133-R2A-59]|nr:J domain-containing protein [Pseudomonas sp. efr-133-R2A-59]